MLYTDLNYTAQKNAELNILARCNNDERQMNELIETDYFQFDMDGEIIEETDIY
jgi:hypothetical protein